MKELESFTLLMDGKPQIFPDSVKSLQKPSGKVVIIFDTSKTNTGMLIGNYMGDIIKVVEFPAPGQAVDYITVTRRILAFCKEYLSHCTIEESIIEDIVTRENEGESSKNPMELHRTRKMLTYIYSNVHMWLLENSNTEVQELSNMTWKTIMGKLNKVNGKKNSLTYVKTLPQHYSKFATLSDDVTDCIAMFMYFLATKGISRTPTIPRGMSTTEYSFGVSIISDNLYNTTAFRMFSFNPDYSLRENVLYCVNKLDKITVIKIPIEHIERNVLNELTLHGEFTLDLKFVNLLVERRA